MPRKFMTAEELLNSPAPEEDIVELGLRIQQGHATDFERMMRAYPVNPDTH